MLGIEDPIISFVYIATILAVILCIVYGIINWNKGAENEDKEMKESEQWKKEDEKIDESF